MRDSVQRKLTYSSQNYCTLHLVTGCLLLAVALLFLTVFSHKLIVDGIFRTSLYTGSASYAFRVIRRLTYIYIHFTCGYTLITSDTFAVFNFDRKKAYLIKQ